MNRALLKGSFFSLLHLVSALPFAHASMYLWLHKWLSQVSYMTKCHASVDVHDCRTLSLQCSSTSFVFINLPNRYGIEFLRQAVALFLVLSCSAVLKKFNPGSSLVTQISSALMIMAHSFVRRCAVVFSQLRAGRPENVTK